MVTYSAEQSFDHARPARVGVLLVNLGTPAAPTPSALRSYLREFLWDPRVIEIPRLRWWVILNAFILPTRSRRSAALYAKIWGPDGSPLLVNSERQRVALEKALQEEFGERIIVALAMRYGSPSMSSVLRQLRDRQVRRLFVLPLYPQYSATTTASGFDALSEELKTWRWVPEIRTVNQFHDHPGYIAALAESVREKWNAEGEPERLLMSFHGIPKRYFLGGDPYHCQCLKTGRLLAEELGIPGERYTISFQSLFGREEWIQPYTDATLRSWAAAGVKSVDVICPGFSADCLETLEEIDVENRKLFIESGGTQYRYIQALNARPAFISTLSEIVRENLHGWLEESAEEAAEKGLQTEARYRQAANSR